MHPAARPKPEKILQLAVGKELRRNLLNAQGGYTQAAVSPRHQVPAVFLHLRLGGGGTTRPLDAGGHADQLSGYKSRAALLLKGDDPL